MTSKAVAFLLAIEGMAVSLIIGDLPLIRAPWDIKAMINIIEQPPSLFVIAT